MNKKKKKNLTIESFIISLESNKKVYNTLRNINLTYAFTVSNTTSLISI